MAPMLLALFHFAPRRKLMEHFSKDVRRVSRVARTRPHGARRAGGVDVDRDRSRGSRRGQAGRSDHAGQRVEGKGSRLAGRLLQSRQRHVDEDRAERTNRLAAALQGCDREVFGAGAAQPRQSQPRRLRRRAAVPADRHQRSAGGDQDHVEQRVPAAAHRRLRPALLRLRERVRRT